VLEAVIAATSISTIIRMTVAPGAAAGRSAVSKPEGAAL
jgi:hypothetical protein